MFSLPKEFPLLCRQHSACCLSEGRRCVFLTNMFKDTVKLILSFKEGESYFWKFYMPRKKYNKKRKRKCYVPNPGMSVLSTSHTREVIYGWGRRLPHAPCWQGWELRGEAGQGGESRHLCPHPCIHILPHPAFFRTEEDELGSIILQPLIFLITKVIFAHC